MENFYIGSGLLKHFWWQGLAKSLFKRFCEEHLCRQAFAKALFGRKGLLVWGLGGQVLLRWFLFGKTDLSDHGRPPLPTPTCLRCMSKGLLRHGKIKDFFQ